MEQITEVVEAGHHGWLLAQPPAVLVVDGPLDAGLVDRAVPAGCRVDAVVETSIPPDRIGGGRWAAAEFDVPLFAPVGVAGGEPLTAGDVVPGFTHVVVESGAAGGIVLDTDPGVFVGDLDRALWVPNEEARERVLDARLRLADRYGSVRVYGSAGARPASDLPACPDPVTGHPPLNRTAIELTNRGEADLFWADPRFTTQTDPVALADAVARLDSPWAPALVDLRTDGDPIAGAIRLVPADLASELGRLAGEREIVVAADEPAIAEQAAGFLSRLGMRARWVAG